MNILLWTLQILLAAAFFAHGWLFLFPPADMVELASNNRISVSVYRNTLTAFLTG